MTANYSAVARFIAPCVKASTITSPSSNNIQVDYSNYSGAIRTLTKVIISWSSDKLTSASSFGTSSLWTDSNGVNFNSSPYTIDSSNWNGSADRGMLDLTTKSLLFSFNKPVSGTTYSITTTFDDGCATTTVSRTFP
jgi:hypothetical protein